MTATISSVIIWIAYILLPAFFLIRIWNNYSGDLLKWILYTSVSAGYILYLFVIGGWPMTMTGYYMRYVVLIALVVSIMKSYLNQKRYFLKIKRSQIITLLIIGFVTLLQIGTILIVFISSFQIPQAIDLDFPLKNGEYYVLQGGNSLFTNHHQEVSAQKFAIDVLKLNRFGFRSKNWNVNFLEDYNIYGDTIYSPCNGKILEIVDDHPDLEPNNMDPDHPAGNYLAIEMEPSKLIVLLAHIQKGSFIVKKGESIKKGQPLARVGNSGNTSEPHLHIHVVTAGSDLLFEAEGVPMTFNNRFLVRNDRVKSLSSIQKVK